MNVNDAHCHFFSRAFFDTLAKGVHDLPRGDPAAGALAKLGWEAPGEPSQLADRWVAELDRHGVGRAALMASVPGDEGSVTRAVARHPERFIGFFMVDPTAADALERTERSIARDRLRGICLFPAMHHVHLHDERVAALFQIAAAHPGTVVFVHCGVLTVGVRRRLGLPSPFDIRLGHPLDLQKPAAAHPAVPVIVPHFGAGFLREALMLADACPNVIFDTSSSNSWIKYHPELTLTGVFRQVLAVVGPERLIFGSDSSFFPRGWHAAVFDAQKAALEEVGATPDVVDAIFRGNFNRVFPLRAQDVQLRFESPS